MWFSHDQFLGKFNMGINYIVPSFFYFPAKFLLRPPKPLDPNPLPMSSSSASSLRSPPTYCTDLVTSLAHES